MGFVSRHDKRDQALPKHRDELLKKTLQDLISDPHVLAIYLAGSLAKGRFDHYSDIDIHTIVSPEMKAEFIRNKCIRSQNWGKVLFFEGYNPSAPYIVTHYDCFVKIDSWYHSPEEVMPSIWLKGYKVLYDPKNIITGVIEEASQLVYQPSEKDVEFWRNKFLAYVHEIYRAVMRDELYEALFNLDQVRWLIVSGWYMEMKVHLDRSFGTWSKLEGKRSKLKNEQQSLLKSWACGRDANQIMNTMNFMIPEYLRLNNYLSNQVEIDPNEEHIKKILEMAN